MPGCRVWISTFHSLGARLLRQYAEHFNLDRNFTIYDQTERVKVVKMALEDANIDNVRFTPENLQSAISKAKNQLLGPERYAGSARIFSPAPRPRSIRATRSACANATPSTSTTCCSSPPWV